jgi:hypothetical protein
MESSKRLRLVIVVLVATLGGLPAWAAPCAGTKRLQLRWSPKTQTALVSVSAMQCERPASCTAGRAAGVLLTKTPITVSIHDAGGHSLSGVVDPRAAHCGARCGQRNRGGCSGGADIHRVAGGFLRYMFTEPGPTTVVASKLRLPAPELPRLTTPLTVTFTDAEGYTVEAELQTCRVRQSAGGTVLWCS